LTLRWRFARWHNIDLTAGAPTHLDDYGIWITSKTARQIDFGRQACNLSQRSQPVSVSFIPTVELCAKMAILPHAWKSSSLRSDVEIRRVTLTNHANPRAIWN